jgi:hypothetical protein
MTMRRPAVLLAGGCLVLLALAACGGQAASSTAPSLTQVAPGAGGSATVSAVPPVTPVPTTAAPPTSAAHPPTGGTTFVPQPIAPGDMTQVPSARVRTMGMAAPPNDVRTSGRQVLFNYGQSGCEHVTASVTAQTAASVTIQVETLVSSSGGAVCPMIVRAVPLKVALNAPLDSRMVIFQHLLSHRS